MKLIRLETREIIDLLVDRHAPERIEAYRSLMAAGETFPPVSVIRLAGRYFLTDGHKRLAACRGLGHPEVLAEVWSTDRWLHDQLLQLGRSAVWTCRVAASVFQGPARRREAAIYLKSVGLHWRRIFRSLRALVLAQTLNRRGHKVHRGFFV